MGVESTLFKEITFIRNGEEWVGDVLVKNGKIAEIAPSIPGHAEHIIREKGLTLIPGCIDPHVHFREPGVTHKESIATGSRAAASGGVTSFFDMPNTKPATITLEALAEKKHIASQTSLVNYNFFMGATSENLEEANAAENVPGIKIFVGSSTGNMLVDKQSELEPFFAKGKHLLAVHAEDETTILENKNRIGDTTNVHDHIKIRSVEAAIKATKRVVQLADKYKRRLHICHLTTQEEAEFLRARNPWVTTEVCTQHLFLWAPDCYDKLGCFAQINPPLREKRHADALWKALKDGTISCVVTDHAPHTIEEKLKPFGQAPSGMPGVETSLPLMLNLVSKGACTLQDVVRWMSEAPATVYNIQNKGKIEIGYDADLVLIDLKAKKRVERSKVISKCGWSAFEGFELTGWPVATYVNGQKVYQEGDFFEDVKGKEVQMIQWRP